MGGLQNLHKNEASYSDDVDVDDSLKTNRRPHTLPVHCWANVVRPDNGVRSH